MGEEVWKTIPGFDGKYEASSFGRVRSLKCGAPRMLSIRTATNGYLVVALTSNGSDRPYGVHRLVAMAFHGLPPNDSDHACHNDGNRQHNTPDNIRWDTPKANAADQFKHGTHYSLNKTHCNHGHELSGENLIIRKGGSRNCRACKRIRESERYHAKVSPFKQKPRVTADDIAIMKAMSAAGITQREIGERFGISQTYVGNILNGKRRNAA